MSIISKHIIISGRVQGVGFRRYVLKVANQFGLKGWVRNLLDGRVEVLIQLNNINEILILNALNKGPKFSNVNRLEVTEVNTEVQFLKFEIRDDGSL